TSGDNGPAERASIKGPSSIAVDGSVIYIGEQLGDRIRRIDAKGVITTFAGGGKNDDIRRGTPAIRATLSQPAGLAIHQGEVYFTEFAGNRVRKVDDKGKLVTVAGTGDRSSKGDGGPALKATVQGPAGIAVDLDGTIYFVEVFGQ